MINIQNFLGINQPNDPYEVEFSESLDADDWQNINAVASKNLRNIIIVSFVVIVFVLFTFSMIL